MPGLTLKARVLFRSNGTILKSSNVTSVTGAAGSYVIVFAAAMATGEYIVRAALATLPANVIASNSVWSINGPGTGGFTFVTKPDGVTQGANGAAIEVYE